MSLDSAILPEIQAYREGRVFTIARLVHAPRMQVFTTFLQPDTLSKWWGPNGFTTAVESAEVRPGGELRFTMTGPDGTVYPNVITYTQIRQPDLITYNHSDGQADSDKRFAVAITLEERGAATWVTLQVTFATDQAAEDALTYNALEGGVQTLTRLNDYLENDRADEALILTKFLKAPRDLVWKVYTEAEHLKQWFGPVQAPIAEISNDFRPGGFMHYAMQVPNGPRVWGRWEYVDIAPIEWLSILVSFSDENLGVTSHPLSPDWPLYMYSGMALIEQDGGTLLHMRTLPYQATEFQRRVFVEGHDSMRQGFGGTYNQLETYLEKLQGR